MCSFLQLSPGVQHLVGIVIRRPSICSLHNFQNCLYNFQNCYYFDCVGFRRTSAFKRIYFGGVHLICLELIFLLHYDIKIHLSLTY